jgi:hydrogenase maturation factor
VNLLASDLATSGLAPQYGIFDFNLPAEMPPRAFDQYWRSFHGECRKLGIAIVAGHTGWYQGCDYTVVGGGVLCAVGKRKSYLLSTMAQVGDDVVLTKGAAIETTAVLSRAFPRTVRKALGDELFARATGYLKKVSTVKDSLVAASVGIHEKGVTAMHDATEGGIVAASLELASASNVGIEISLDDVHVSQETSAVCRLFQIDPMTSLSEGSLILTSKPRKTRSVLNALGAKGVQAAVVGSIRPSGSGNHGTYHGRSIQLKYPASDPYWGAFWKATKKRWN